MERLLQLELRAYRETTATSLSLLEVEDLRCSQLTYFLPVMFDLTLTYRSHAREDVFRFKANVESLATEAQAKASS